MSDIRPPEIKPVWDCKECSLHKFASRRVWGRGPAKPLFMLIGQSPGQEEDRTGIPFHPDAPAGRLLTDILKEIGVKRSEIYISNAIKCFEGYKNNGGGVISTENIKACKHHLINEMENIDCEYVVLAGNESMKAILGHTGITKEHGMLRIGPNGRKYFPIFHPASALPNRTPENRNRIRDALKQLVSRIRLGEDDPLAKFDCKIITTTKMLDQFEKELAPVMNDPKQLVVSDYETNSTFTPDHGATDYRVSGASFAWETAGGWFLPLDHQNPTDVLTGRDYERAKDLFRRYGRSPCRKGNQNLKYEYNVTRGVFGVRMKNLYTDPMLMSHLLNPQPGTHGLKKLAWSVGMGGYDNPLEEWFLDNKIPEKKRDYTKVPLEILGKYAIGDAICVLKYHNRYHKEIIRRGQYKFYHKWVMAAVAPYAEMESAGMLFDSVYMDKLDTYYKDMHKDMRRQLRRIARTHYRKLGKEFNFDSPDQLARFLHEWLNLDKLKRRQIEKQAKDRFRKKWALKKDRDKVSTDPADYVVFKANGIVSTTKSVIKSLIAYYPLKDPQLEFLRLLSEYRAGRTRYVRNVKGMKRYVCPDGRVRSSLLQHGTGTSRRSSRDPNQQNIPRDAIVKRGFVAPEWHLFVINDYKNLEVRMAAAISGDKYLLAAFNSGKDVHSYMGSKAYNADYDKMIGVLGKKWDEVREDDELLKAYKRYSDIRNRSKIMWWVLLFGGGPDKIAAQAGIPFSEAVRLQQVVFREFPGLREMFDKFARFAEKHGYAATNFGRRRYLDNIRSSSDNLYGEAKRQGLNTPIQGTAADVTLRAVTLLYWEWRNCHIKARNVQEVHDAVTQEAHYRHVFSVISSSRLIMEGITCPASEGKITLEVDTSVGAHLGSKLKVDKEVLEMAEKDPRSLYELCRRDLNHPPEFYA